MKRKIYKLLSSSNRLGGQGLFALALTVFSGTAYSQITHTLNYTGSVQTLNLQAGTFSVQMWGGDGYTETPGFNGKGGYSSGILTLTSPQTVYIYVGGIGSYPASAVAPNAWTFNGGGIGYPAANSSYGNGGGASDVRTVGGTWDNAASLASRAIVAGGGGAGRNSSYIGAHGGGLTGATGTYFNPDQIGGPTGGSQTAGGSNTGYTSGLTLAGPGKAMTWDGNALTASYLAGGGGGYYGGASGRVAGGGGSSYIGGVTSGTTVMFGQAGFVTNPVATTGNGIVFIKELCNISLTASGTNSLNPSICAGQSVTLTTDGISNYAWSTGNTTNSIIVVSPAATTVYTLSATSPSNCTTSKSITVTVNSALPVLTITNTPTSMCLGKTATLTAGGALTYTWTGGITNGQTFTPTATSGYTVTGQNGCGQTTASTTITIAPLAVSVSSSSNNICSGSTAVLTATAAVNGFTWMPGSVTGSNVTVAPLVNTVYTLTASDGTCNGVATLTLDTKPIPALVIAASATNVCEGSPVTLTVTGANTYTWATSASNANIITVNPSAASSYVVSGTNGVNCVSSISQIVVTKPNPVVSVSTNKNLVCEGGASTLTASGGSSTYQWTNGPATNTNVVNPVVNSTYTVTGTGANGCSTEKTITINVLSVSVTVSSASTTICEGASAVLNAGGATTYTWVGFGNFASATVSPTLTTTYTVNANTTSQGISCPSTNSITITVNALPTVSVSSTKTLVCRTDGSITITANGAVSYVWSPTQTNNTLSVRPQSTTTYSVTGTDANGCKDGATIQIVVGPCTGIEEFKGGKTISVYPNPSNGDITVNTESDITLKVMNELGQLVQTLTLNANNNHSVSITGLANGIYFIVGQNETDTVNQKIVVNK